MSAGEVHTMAHVRSRAKLPMLLGAALLWTALLPSSSMRYCWAIGHGRRVALLGLGSLQAAGLPSRVHALQVKRPDGFSYETLSPGSEGSTPRDGPPKYASKVWLRFTGHIDSFDGKVFDSSSLRGKRKPSQKDYVEITTGVEPTFAPAMWEALKLMKVGERGRFMQPPQLSFAEGKAAFEGDEDSQVKQIPAGATLYYDVELVNIIRP
eukprot:TRINITY_DN37415_c0_g1_i1.p1 TRINITY_DN37415_c0_g1~~TRINITY_DN37415_c0_g1_i1.p1  ORF type:complete len:209 (+),score=37.33 TRINITY_DN37415_c0_g1_i1:30-656(+)